MDMAIYLEIGALVIMLVGLIGVFVNRVQSGEGGKAKGLGIRTLQHIALIFVAPTVLILALERSIDAEATTAILGALVGYVFASIENDKS